MIRIHFKQLDKIAKSVGIRPAYTIMTPEGKTFRGVAYNISHDIVAVLYKGRGPWKALGEIR